MSTQLNLHGIPSLTLFFSFLYACHRLDVLCWYLALFVGLSINIWLSSQYKLYFETYCNETLHIYMCVYNYIKCLKWFRRPDPKVKGQVKVSITINIIYTPNVERIIFILCQVILDYGLMIEAVYSTSRSKHMVRGQDHSSLVPLFIFKCFILILEYWPWI